MTLTEQFIKERQIFKNVSPATVVWYQQSLKRFEGALDSKEAIGRRIVELKERGLAPISINTALRCVRAYLNWCHQEGFLKEKVRVGYLRCEQKIISSFSPEQIRRVTHRKPVGRNETRAHILALTALDSGLRIQEMLRLTRQDVDLDNLILHVHGKGNKQRLVPMSIELRKILYRYLSKHNHTLVFATSRGTRLTARNADRDFKVMCRKVGITGVRCSFHTLRHSFAVNYLRAGGNLYYLQRILGHSSITTTERYLRSLGIEDLQRVHDGLSLLLNGR